MSAALFDLGAIAGLWGIVWFMWDRNANAPGYLVCGGLATLIAGSLL